MWFVIAAGVGAVLAVGISFFIGRRSKLTLVRDQKAEDAINEVYDRKVAEEKAKADSTDATLSKSEILRIINRRDPGN